MWIKLLQIHSQLLCESLQTHKIKVPGPLHSLTGCHCPNTIPCLSVRGNLLQTDIFLTLLHPQNSQVIHNGGKRGTCSPPSGWLILVQRYEQDCSGGLDLRTNICSCFRQIMTKSGSGSAPGRQKRPCKSPLDGPEGLVSIAVAVRITGCHPARWQARRLRACASPLWVTGLRSLPSRRPGCMNA